MKKGLVNPETYANVVRNTNKALGGSAVKAKVKGSTRDQMLVGGII